MRKYLLLLTSICLVLTSCKKDIDVDEVSFEVTTKTLTAQVGKPVVFELNGNPDIISFYSGELGKEYDFVGKRILPNTISLKFETQILDGTQENQFAVLASTSFNGTYDIATAQSTNWVDITSRFRIATPADNRAFVASGDVNISDLIVDGQPFYIAFKYIGRPETVNGRFNLWRVQNLNLQTANAIDALTSLGNVANGGWRSVLTTNFETGRVLISGTSLTLRGNGTNREVLTEAYIISKRFDIAKTNDFGLDKAIAIKSIAEPALKTYEYTFTKPGTYKVTFVGKNASINQTKSQIKQIEIVVNP